MAEHNDLGQKGEMLAAKHLEENGYFIHSRNWRLGKSEIDLVAEKDGFIIFVEVKTRMADFFEEPALAVTRKKQAQITKAAEGYFKETDCQLESRFDIITVIFDKNNAIINHIEDAFYPMARK